MSTISHDKSFHFEVIAHLLTGFACFIINKAKSAHTHTHIYIDWHAVDSIIIKSSTKCHLVSILFETVWLIFVAMDITYILCRKPYDDVMLQYWNSIIRIYACNVTLYCVQDVICAWCIHWMALKTTKCKPNRITKRHSTK